MIPPHKIPPEIKKKIFEIDLMGKKLQFQGAIWKIISTNPKTNKLSLELVGIVEPSDMKEKQV